MKGEKEKIKPTQWVILSWAIRTYFLHKWRRCILQTYQSVKENFRVGGRRRALSRKKNHGEKKITGRETKGSKEIENTRPKKKKDDNFKWKMLSKRVPKV